MSILLITNKSDITTDFIVKKLKEKNEPFYRLNTEEIGETLQVNFNFLAEEYTIFDECADYVIDLKKISSVYYRRPEINDRFNDLTKGQQNFIKAELAYTLEGIYKILDKAFWINKVHAIRNAENKIYQLLLAREIGFEIPGSFIGNDTENAMDFYTSQDEKCIIKPIKSGLIHGEEEEGVIFTNKVELNQSNIDRIKRCPVYLQNHIQKNADVRVTIVGNHLFAAQINSQETEESQVDWRKAKHSLPHLSIELPEDIKTYCFLLLEKLSLNFGAIDFILDKDLNFIFLEINPNGQWAWVEKQLNFKISDAITDLLAKNAIN